MTTSFAKRDNASLEISLWATFAEQIVTLWQFILVYRSIRIMELRQRLMISYDHALHAVEHYSRSPERCARL